MAIDVDLTSFDFAPVPDDDWSNIFAIDLGRWRPELHPRDSHGRFRNAWRMAAGAMHEVERLLAGFNPPPLRSDRHASSYLRGQRGPRTKKQQDTLDYFLSREGNEAIQASLRGGFDPRTDKGENAARVRELESMMRPLEHDLILSRVMGPDAFGLPPERLSEVEEWTGRRAADAGFSPMNVGSAHAVGAPHIEMRILVPKGTRAIIVGDGGDGPNSRTVILDRSQPIRIGKVQSDGRGGFYALATVAHGRGAKGERPTMQLGRELPVGERSPAIAATPDEFERRGLEPDISAPGPQEQPERFGPTAPAGRAPTARAAQGPAPGPVKPAPEGAPFESKPVPAEEVPTGAGRVTTKEDLNAPEAAPAPRERPRSRGQGQVMDEREARLADREREADRKLKQAQADQARADRMQDNAIKRQERELARLDAEVERLRAQREADIAGRTIRADEGTQARLERTDRQRDDRVLEADNKNRRDPKWPATGEDTRIALRANRIRAARGEEELDIPDDAPPPPAETDEEAAALAPVKKARKAAAAAPRKRVRKAAPAKGEEEGPPPEVAAEMEAAPPERGVSAPRVISRERGEDAILERVAGIDPNSQDPLDQALLREADRIRTRRASEGTPEAPQAPTKRAPRKVAARKAAPEAAPTPEAAAPEAAPEAAAPTPATVAKRIAKRVPTPEAPPAKKAAKAVPGPRLDEEQRNRLLEMTPEELKDWFDSVSPPKAAPGRARGAKKAAPEAPEAPVPTKAPSKRGVKKAAPETPEAPAAPVKKTPTKRVTKAAPEAPAAPVKKAPAKRVAKKAAVDTEAVKESVPRHVQVSKEIYNQDPDTWDAVQTYGLDPDVYKEINACLRGEACTDRAKKLIGGIDGHMKESAITKPIVLHRGSSNGEKLFGDGWSGDLTGREITEPGYMSTTTSERVARQFTDQRGGEGGRVMFEVRTPAGTRGVSIDGHRWDEVLLDRGLKLRVAEDRGTDEDGIRRLVVDVVPASKPAPGVKRARKAVSGEAPEPLAKKALAGKVTKKAAPEVPVKAARPKVTRAKAAPKVPAKKAIPERKPKTQKELDAMSDREIIAYADSLEGPSQNSSEVNAKRMAQAARNRIEEGAPEGETLDQLRERLTKPAPEARKVTRAVPTETADQLRDRFKRERQAEHEARVAAKRQPRPRGTGLTPDELKAQNKREIEAARKARAEGPKKTQAQVEAESKLARPGVKKAEAKATKARAENFDKVTPDVPGQEGGLLRTVQRELAEGQPVAPLKQRLQDRADTLRRRAELEREDAELDPTGRRAAHYDRLADIYENAASNIGKRGANPDRLTPGDKVERTNKDKSITKGTVAKRGRLTYIDWEDGESQRVLPSRPGRGIKKVGSAAPGEAPAKAEKPRTLVDLRKEAATLGVPGRSTMDREKLTDAIEARRQREGESDADHKARLDELNARPKVTRAAPRKIASRAKAEETTPEAAPVKAARPTVKRAAAVRLDAQEKEDVAGLTTNQRNVYNDLRRKNIPHGTALRGAQESPARKVAVRKATATEAAPAKKAFRRTKAGTPEPARPSTEPPETRGGRVIEFPAGRRAAKRRLAGTPEREVSDLVPHTKRGGSVPETDAPEVSGVQAPTKAAKVARPRVKRATPAKSAAPEAPEAPAAVAANSKADFAPGGAKHLDISPYVDEASFGQVDVPGDSGMDRVPDHRNLIKDAQRRLNEGQTPGQVARDLELSAARIRSSAATRYGDYDRDLFGPYEYKDLPDDIKASRAQYKADKKATYEAWQKRAKQLNDLAGVIGKLRRPRAARKVTKAAPEAPAPAPVAKKAARKVAKAAPTPPARLQRSPRLTPEQRSDIESLNNYDKARYRSLRRDHVEHDAALAQVQRERQAADLGAAQRREEAAAAENRRKSGVNKYLEERSLRAQQSREATEKANREDLAPLLVEAGVKHDDLTDFQRAKVGVLKNRVERKNLSKKRAAEMLREEGDPNMDAIANVLERRAPRKIAKKAAPAAKKAVPEAPAKTARPTVRRAADKADFAPGGAKHLDIKGIEEGIGERSDFNHGKGNYLDDIQADLDRGKSPAEAVKQLEHDARRTRDHTAIALGGLFRDETPAEKADREQRKAAGYGHADRLTALAEKVKKLRRPRKVAAKKTAPEAAPEAAPEVPTAVKTPASRLKAGDTVLIDGKPVQLAKVGRVRSKEDGSPGPVQLTAHTPGGDEVSLGAYDPNETLDKVRTPAPAKGVRKLAQKAAPEKAPEAAPIKLTPAQHRALQGIDSGEKRFPRGDLQKRLVDSGVVEYRNGRYEVTPAGKDVLARENKRPRVTRAATKAAPEAPAPTKAAPRKLASKAASETPEAARTRARTAPRKMVRATKKAAPEAAPVAPETGPEAAPKLDRFEQERFDQLSPAAKFRYNELREGPRKATHPEALALAQNMDRYAARRDRVKEYAGLSREQFDALPDERKKLILDDLKSISESGDTRTIPSNRTSMGTTIRGIEAGHVTQARSLRNQFTRTPGPTRPAKPTADAVIARLDSPDFDPDGVDVQDMLKGMDRGEVTRVAEHVGVKNPKGYTLAGLRREVRSQVDENKRNAPKAPPAKKAAKAVPEAPREGLLQRVVRDLEEDKAIRTERPTVTRAKPRKVAKPTPVGERSKVTERLEAMGGDRDKIRAELDKDQNNMDVLREVAQDLGLDDQQPKPALKKSIEEALTERKRPSIAPPEAPAKATRAAPNVPENMKDRVRPGGMLALAHIRKGDRVMVEQASDGSWHPSRKITATPITVDRQDIVTTATRRGGQANWRVLVGHDEQGNEIHVGRDRGGYSGVQTFRAARPEGAKVGKAAKAAPEVQQQRVKAVKKAMRPLQEGNGVAVANGYDADENYQKFIQDRIEAGTAPATTIRYMRQHAAAYERAAEEKRLHNAYGYDLRESGKREQMLAQAARWRKAADDFEAENKTIKAPRAAKAAAPEGAAPQRPRVTRAKKAAPEAAPKAETPAPTKATRPRVTRAKKAEAAPEAEAPTPTKATRPRRIARPKVTEDTEPEINDISEVPHPTGPKPRKVAKKFSPEIMKEKVPSGIDPDDWRRARSLGWSKEKATKYGEARARAREQIRLINKDMERPKPGELWRARQAEIEREELGGPAARPQTEASKPERPTIKRAAKKIAAAFRKPFRRDRTEAKVPESPDADALMAAKRRERALELRRRREEIAKFLDEEPTETPRVHDWGGPDSLTEGQRNLYDKLPVNSRNKYDYLRGQGADHDTAFKQVDEEARRDFPESYAKAMGEKVPRKIAKRAPGELTRIQQNAADSVREASKDGEWVNETDLPASRYLLKQLADKGVLEVEEVPGRRAGSVVRRYRPKGNAPEAPAAPAKRAAKKAAPEVAKPERPTVRRATTPRKVSTEAVKPERPVVKRAAPRKISRPEVEAPAAPAKATRARAPRPFKDNAAKARAWGAEQGYKGRAGGWIYDKDGNRTKAHGWDDLYKAHSRDIEKWDKQRLTGGGPEGESKRPSPAPPKVTKAAAKAVPAKKAFPRGRYNAALKEGMSGAEAEEWARANDQSITAMREQRRGNRKIDFFDRARTDARLASDLNETLANEGSDRSILHQIDSAEKPKPMGRLLGIPAQDRARMRKAFETGGREGLRKEIANFERRQGISRIGNTGEVVPFDPEVHRIPGRMDAKKGDPVLVLRPGHKVRAPGDDHDTVVTHASVMPDRATKRAKASAAAKKAAAEVPEPARRPRVTRAKKAAPEAVAPERPKVTRAASNKVESADDVIANRGTIVRTPEHVGWDIVQHSGNKRWYILDPDGKLHKDGRVSSSSSLEAAQKRLDRIDKPAAPEAPAKAARRVAKKAAPEAGLSPTQVKRLQGLNDKNDWTSESSRLPKSEMDDLVKQGLVQRRWQRFENGVGTNSAVKITAKGKRLLAERNAGPEAPAKRATFERPRVTRAATKATPESRELPPLANGTRRKSMTNVQEGDVVRGASGYQGNNAVPRKVVKVERDGRNIKITRDDGSFLTGSPNTAVWLGEPETPAAKKTTAAIKKVTKAAPEVPHAPEPAKAARRVTRKATSPVTPEKPVARSTEAPTPGSDTTKVDRAKQRLEARAAGRRRQTADGSGELADALNQVIEARRSNDNPSAFRRGVRQLLASPTSDSGTPKGEGYNDLRRTLGRESFTNPEELERRLRQELGKRGITMTSIRGAQTRFNPDLHRSLGEDIPDNADVEVVRPGLIFTDEDGTVVTLQKPVVRRLGTGDRESTPLGEGLSADPSVREVQVENRIRQAYRELVTDNSPFVGLADLREKLGDLDRADVDEGLRRLGRGNYNGPGEPFLTPEHNQKVLTARDRAAAVDLGGDANHVISFRDPSPRPLPEGGGPEVEKPVPPGMKRFDGPLGPIDLPSQREVKGGALDHARELLKDIQHGVRKSPDGIFDYVDRHMSAAEVRRTAGYLGVDIAPGDRKVTMRNKVVAEIGRRLGFEHRETNKGREELEKLNRTQLRDMLPAGRTLPKSASKQELIDVLMGDEDTPGSRHATTTPGIDSIRASVEGGTTDVRGLGNGSMGRVTRVRDTSGKELIRKRLKRDWYIGAEEQADSENLTSRVGQAIGAPVPAVYQPTSREVYMDFVHGKLADQETPARIRAAVRSDAGRRLHLLDVITGNVDRHNGNWIIDADGNPVGIDNSLGFRRIPGSSQGPWRDSSLRFEDGEIRPAALHGKDPFMRHYKVQSGTFDRDGVSKMTEKWSDTVPWSTEELQDARRKIVDLEPEFKQLGREDWHRESLERLDALIKRSKPASGPSVTGRIDRVADRVFRTPEGRRRTPEEVYRPANPRVISGLGQARTKDILSHDTGPEGIPVRRFSPRDNPGYTIHEGTAWRRDGVTYIVEHDKDSLDAAVTVRNLMAAHHASLPAEGKKYQRGYIWAGGSNPQDAYWGQKYGIKDMTSVMSGGDGELVVWGSGFKEGTTQETLQSVMNHEYGHSVDTLARATRISSSRDWLGAGESDRRRSRRPFDWQPFVGQAAWLVSPPEKDSKYPNGINPYAQSDPMEDFGESMALYLQGPIGQGRVTPNGPVVQIWFRDLYPARAAVLDRLFPSVRAQQREQIASVRRRQ